jgi:hypothetical protein
VYAHTTTLLMHQHTTDTTTTLLCGKSPTLSVDRMATHHMGETTDAFCAGCKYMKSSTPLHSYRLLGG